MNSGLLWYDGDKHKTVTQKITEAAEYYQKKYGRIPEICMVNPKDLDILPIKSPDQIDVMGRNVTVRTWRSIPTGHFWLGFDGPEVVEAQPEPKPEKSDVVAAFEQHARKVTVDA